MRILITNVTLAGRTGTETVTRDLALGYLMAGHSPVVYTRKLGPIAEELRAKSIPVTDAIENISGHIDVIHGHHLNACIAALVKFNTTPAISVVHDFQAWHDSPPKIGNIRRYISISTGFAERLIGEAGISPELIKVVLNGVDTGRFPLGPPLPPKPKRALAFAKNLGHVSAVREACAGRGIDIDFIGGLAGPLIDEPGSIMANYDLVFASARSAIEALACGRAVIVCDGRGMAGLVDEDNYGRWRGENFGLRILSRPVTVANCLQEIDRYNAASARNVAQILISDGCMDVWTNSYLDVLNEVVLDGAIEPDTPGLARHLEIWSPQIKPEWPWMIERQQLSNQRDQFFADLEAFPIGERVSTNNDSGRKKTIHLFGFHEPEDWGVWGNDSISIIKILVQKPPVILHMEVDAQLARFGGQDVHLTVMANGRPVADIHPKSSEEASDSDLFSDVKITFPLNDIIGADGMLWVYFTVSTLSRPVDFGISADSRHLGIAVRAITILTSE